jgi:hypothetical protein
LIAGFMQTAATGEGASIIARAIEAAANALGETSLAIESATKRE